MNNVDNVQSGKMQQLFITFLQQKIKLRDFPPSRVL